MKGFDEHASFGFRSYIRAAKGIWASFKVLFFFERFWHWFDIFRFPSLWIYAEQLTNRWFDFSPWIDDDQESKDITKFSVSWVEMLWQVMAFSTLITL